MSRTTRLHHENLAIALLNRGMALYTSDFVMLSNDSLDSSQLLFKQSVEHQPTLSLATSAALEHAQPHIGAPEAAARASG